jgi:hypothetical protein
MPVFWDVTFLISVHRLLVISNVVPTSPILVTLIIDTIRSYEMIDLTNTTRRHIPEDHILKF